MQPKTYFIIGANGVGKSTLLHLLADLLPKDRFDLHDFDERGVPDNADKAWRMNETTHWLEVGEKNRAKNVSTVVCGFAKPAEIGDGAETILLDVDGPPLEARLRKRYQTEASLGELKRTTGKTVEKFIADNIWVASVLRKECQEKGYKTIGTSDVAPETVAERVANVLLGHGDLQTAT
jgi:energy-coupling factor transporter ATP-binding protein EcfA2